MRHPVSNPEPVGVLSVPGLLEWMGAGFGDAVARGNPQSLSIGGIRLEDVIRALPAAIYTTDANGRITFYNEAVPARTSVPVRTRECAPRLERGGNFNGCQSSRTP